MAKKKPTKAEQEHMNNVAELNCIACRQLGHYDTPAEIHHLRTGMGMGQRNNHFMVIPLCPTHHRTGPDAFHQSKKNFEARFGTELELLEEVKRLL